MKIDELLESKLKPTLEEFLNSNKRNEYIYFKSSNNIWLKSYVRKSSRYINGIRFHRVLDRANTSIDNSKIQLKMINNNINMASTGAYREFDLYMTELAKKYNYDGIYVENVLNDKLLDVLIRYGYKLLPNSNPSSFWKKL